MGRDVLLESNTLSLNDVEVVVMPIGARQHVMTVGGVGVDVEVEVVVAAVAFVFVVAACHCQLMVLLRARLLLDGLQGYLFELRLRPVY